MIQEPKKLEINCSDILPPIGMSSIFISLLKHGTINDSNIQMLCTDAKLRSCVAKETGVSMSTVRREIKKYCECGILTKIRDNIYKINADAVKAMW